MVEAGILEPAEPEATGWSSMAFPRKKPGSDPVKVRWVTDFCDLNKALDRPIWGGESSSQILQRLDPRAKFFAVFDAISGFHQIAVDPESSKLLNITTVFGNYVLKVLGQGLCSSQDLFNFLSRGTTLTDPNFQILKNVDDFLIWASTLEELEEQINKLMAMCKRMNLKLSPVKFKISDCVKFGGTIISSKRLRDGNVIFMDPPDKRVVA